MKLLRTLIALLCVSFLLMGEFTNANPTEVQAEAKDQPKDAKAPASEGLIMNALRRRRCADIMIIGSGCFG